MAEYKLVLKKPEKIGKDEFIIEKPNFMEEIEKTKGRRGTSGLTTASYLRDVLMAITDKYDNTINPYHLKLSKYQGIAYTNDKEISDIIMNILDDNKLNLVEKAVEFKLKNRPLNSQIIYYVSDDTNGLNAFLKMGINKAQDSKKKENNQ